MAPSYTQWRAASPSSKDVGKPIQKVKWEAGEIAFLRHGDEFTIEDYNDFIDTKYLHLNATCHPVIILDWSADHRNYLVTTISAYGSGHYNDNMPPWKQPYHKHKEVEGFRAFEGSARPSCRYPHLQLADGKTCPKLRTSWVYMHNVFVVPATTLKIFDKSPQQLRMAPESLSELLADMKARSQMYRTAINRFSSTTGRPWLKPVNPIPAAAAAPVTAKPAWPMLTPPITPPSFPKMVQSQPVNSPCAASGLPTPTPSPKGSPSLAATLSSTDTALNSRSNIQSPIITNTKASSSGRSIKPFTPVSGTMPQLVVGVLENVPITLKGHQQQQKRKQKQHRGKGKLIYSLTTF